MSYENAPDTPEEPRECSAGCGGRTAYEADSRDCACDGECTMDPDWGGELP